MSDWETVAKRLAAVPGAVEAYIELIAPRRAARVGTPARQVRAGIEQSRDNVGPDGFFQTYARDAEDRGRH